MLALDNLRCTLKRKKRLEARKGIRVDLIGKASDNIEQLLSVITEWKDLEGEDSFPILKRQLTLFMEMVQNYTTYFKKKISQLCGSADDEDFDAFLKEQEASVFSCFKWLDEKKVEMKLLQGIFKSSTQRVVDLSPGIQVQDTMLIDQVAHHLVCLAFKLPSDEDAPFSNMRYASIPKET